MNFSRSFLWVLGIVFISILGYSKVYAATPSEKRISKLLKQMTLAEKLGQLQQACGPDDGTINPDQLAQARAGKIGSLLNQRGAQATDLLQRAAVAESRLKIPLLFGFDVIHGYRTIFPVPLAEASSFDLDLAEATASAAAKEAASAGVRWTFAPMVDIARDPRWGRVVEGSGEDPYLGAQFARVRVHGFQGDDLSQPGKIAACAKHWVGYGASEAGRDYGATYIPEILLNEVYYPPFKAALDAGVATFMSAFNDLNGVPASGNRHTLRDVLKHEWRFDGFVVSDWTSVQELISHRFVENGREAARSALISGVDMEMVSTLYATQVPELLKSGALKMSVLNDAVRRVLRIKERLGLFSQPYASGPKESEVLLSPEHRALARRAASRSIVLLKNEGGLLPLRKNLKKIVVVGALADSQVDALGPWPGDGKPKDAITLLQSLRLSVSPDTEIAYFPLGFTPSSDEVASAVAASYGADAVLAVVGETSNLSGEAASRSELGLPGEQQAWLKQLHAASKFGGAPVIALLMNGRPLTLPWEADHLPALLETWFLGTESGPAITDVLFGDVNPGGKLPITFPRSVGQIPIYYGERESGRPFEEGNKYTSKYLDVPNTPLFPFGFGLSYTTFEVGVPQVTAAGDRVTTEVTNTGKVTGDEVVQLYVSRPGDLTTHPVKELRGFKRVTLKPGQSEKISFFLENLSPPTSRTPYNVDIFVGTSSALTERALLSN